MTEEPTIQPQISQRTAMRGREMLKCLQKVDVIGGGGGRGGGMREEEEEEEEGGRRSNLDESA